jgi:hypothetical protein
MKMMFRLAIAAAAVRSLQRSLNSQSACQSAVMPTGLVEFNECTNNNMSDLNIEGIMSPTRATCTAAFHKNKTLQCLPILIGSDVLESVAKFTEGPRPVECSDAEWAGMQKECAGGPLSAVSPQVDSKTIKAAINNLFTECEKVAPGVTTAILTKAEKARVEHYRAEIRAAVIDPSTAAAKTTAILLIAVAAFMY